MVYFSNSYVQANPIGEELVELVELFAQIIGSNGVPATVKLAHITIDGKAMMGFRYSIIEVSMTDGLIWVVFRQFLSLFFQSKLEAEVWREVSHRSPGLSPSCRAAPPCG